MSKAKEVPNNIFDIIIEQTRKEERNKTLEDVKELANKLTILGSLDTDEFLLGLENQKL